jgi:hypothetical protein
MSDELHFDEVALLLSIVEKAPLGRIRTAAQLRLAEIEESLKPEPEQPVEPAEGDTSHNPPPAQREPVEPVDDSEPARLEDETDEEYEARLEEWRQAHE